MIELKTGNLQRAVRVAPWLGEVNTATEPNAIRHAGLVFQPYVGAEPLGAESLVNVTTANFQGGGTDQGMMVPSPVASNASGDYVVAWQSIDGATSRILARSYHADGTPASGEITVTANVQTWRNPQVAISDNGRFAVAWGQVNPAFADGEGTFVRAFQADGTPATNVMTVAAATSNSANLMSDVAMDAAGNFAVLYRNWKPSATANAESATIRLQRYTAAGAANGGAITIANTTAFYPYRQSIAMDASGRFVVAWDDNARTVFAQRYSATAQKVGAQITVTSTSSPVTSWQSFVNMNDSGRFVVTWSYNASGKAYVMAQVYDWGTPVGGNISLLESDHWISNWQSAGCDIDDDNNVTFSWGVRVAGSTQGTGGVQQEIAVRRMTGDGVLEPTYLVNTTTQGFQGYPGVAATGNDQFVVVWQGRGPGDDAGIFMQRFANGPPPPPPTTFFSIDDVSLTEGNAGTTMANFTVTLSAASSDTVTVQFMTANGTASSGSDFQSTAGTLAFAPGVTSQVVSIPIIGDRLAENDESFVVNLSNPVNAGIVDGQGSGTVVDDEPRITISDVSLTEGNSGTKLFTFIVTLSAAYDQPVTMSFATANGTASTNGANADYVAQNGTLTFAAGEMSKTITIAVKGDTKVESNETFFVNLTGNSSNSLLADNQALGTILNDD